MSNPLECSTFTVPSRECKAPFTLSVSAVRRRTGQEQIGWCLHTTRVLSDGKPVVLYCTRQWVGVIVLYCNESRTNYCVREPKMRGSGTVLHTIWGFKEWWKYVFYLLSHVASFVWWRPFPSARKDSISEFLSNCFMLLSSCRPTSAVWQRN